MIKNSIIRKFSAILAMTAVSAVLFPFKSCTKELHVTNVTLNLSDAFLLVGGTLTLEATVEPEDATNKTVTWSSNDDLVATVNTEGEVAAVAPGTAIITVTTDDGKFTTSCAVNVTETGITMTTLASELRIAVTGTDFLIDWGDGKISNANDAYSWSDYPGFNFFHNYSGKDAHNIVITGNVAVLDCSVYPFDSNQLTSLDVSLSTALTRLNCSNNQLTTLDVSQNTALKGLFCNSNQLIALDVSKNTSLKELDCGGNQLTSLDVSANTALRNLFFKDNQITNLDVSRNASLLHLEVCGNRLTALDMSKNTELRSLCVRYNQLTASALNDLFGTLPDRSKSGSGMSIMGNPGVNDCDLSIAEEKGWWPDSLAHTD